MAIVIIKVLKCTVNIHWLWLYPVS